MLVDNTADSPNRYIVNGVLQIGTPLSRTKARAPPADRLTSYRTLLIYGDATTEWINSDLYWQYR